MRAALATGLVRAAVFAAEPAAAQREIGAGSRVQIDRFVYDPNEGRSFLATLTKGALRFFSGRQEGQNSGDLQTPAGRIGIRGTALDLLVGEDAQEIAEDEDFVDRVDDVDSDDDEATLVVLRGPGARTAGGLAAGSARGARSAGPCRLHPAQRRSADRTLRDFEQCAGQSAGPARARGRARLRR